MSMIDEHERHVFVMELLIAPPQEFLSNWLERPFLRGFWLHKRYGSIVQNWFI